MANAEVYLMPIVAAVVFVLGCLGNGTLVFLIVKYKQLKTKRNAFLLTIAVADLLAAAICAPIFGATTANQNGWLFGNGLCKIYEFLIDLAPQVVVLALAVLSVERCVNRFNPRRSPETIKRGVAIALTVILWLLPVLIDLRQLIFARMKSTHNDEGYVCIIHGPYHLRNIYQAMDTGIRLFLQYVIPVVTIAICFVLVALKKYLGSGSDAQATVNQGSRGTVNRRDSSSCYTKLTLALVIVYVVCWFPWHVYRMWFFFGRTGYNDAWAGFSIFANVLSYVDCCIRAWVVFAIDPAFNHYFKKHLCCCCYDASSEAEIPLDDQNDVAQQGSFSYTEKDRC